MVVHNEKNIFTFSSFLSMTLEMLKLLEAKFRIRIPRIGDGDYSIAFQLFNFLPVTHVNHL